MEVSNPILVVFTGLPCSGKSTIAKLLAHKASAIHLRIDSIEQALLRSALNIHSVEDSGYCVGYAVAQDILKNPQIVIADSVNPIEATRQGWRNVARCTNARIIEVEIVCSDKNEHRNRIEARSADIEGHVLPGWQDIIDREYDAWDAKILVIDTMHVEPETAVNELIEAIRQSDNQ